MQLRDPHLLSCIISTVSLEKSNILCPPPAHPLTNPHIYTPHLRRTSIYELIHLRAHPLTSLSTYKLIHLQAHPLTSSSTYKPTYIHTTPEKHIHLQAHPLTSSSTYKPTYIHTTPGKHIHLQAHIFTSSSTYKLIHLQTHIYTHHTWEAVAPFISSVASLAAPTPIGVSNTFKLRGSVFVRITGCAASLFAACCAGWGSYEKGSEGCMAPNI